MNNSINRLFPFIISLTLIGCGQNRAEWIDRINDSEGKTLITVQGAEFHKRDPANLDDPSMVTTARWLSVSEITKSSEALLSKKLTLDNDVITLEARSDTVIFNDWPLGKSRLVKSKFSPDKSDRENIVTMLPSADLVRIDAKDSIILCCSKGMLHQITYDGRELTAIQCDYITGLSYAVMSTTNRIAIGYENTLHHGASITEYYDRAWHQRCVLELGSNLLSILYLGDNLFVLSVKTENGVSYLRLQSADGDILTKIEIDKTYKNDSVKCSIPKIININTFEIFIYTAKIFFDGENGMFKSIHKYTIHLDPPSISAISK